MGKYYKEYKQKLKEEQSAKSYDEIKQDMSTSEYMLELDNLPVQNHNWVDRGLKMTCENAGHLFHEAWKIRKPMTKA